MGELEGELLVNFEVNLEGSFKGYLEGKLERKGGELGGEHGGAFGKELGGVHMIRQTGGLLSHFVRFFLRIIGKIQETDQNDQNHIP